jgi:rhodanese-related sulfurtransferase
MSIIDIATARDMISMSPDVLLVDVRTPGEYAGAHIPGAINLPLDQVDRHLQQIVRDAGGRMILICQSGARADRCQSLLAKAGINDSLVLSGGMNAWAAAGAPVVRARRRWELERQVRLVAGGIVAASILASVVWPPARFVAGFIGAGLVFAAVTNTCGMAMMLAKLPYNRPAQATDIQDSLDRLAGARR